MTEVTITTVFKKSLLSAKLGKERKINHTTFRKLLLKLSHIYKKLYTIFVKIFLFFFKVFILSRLFKRRPEEDKHIDRYLPFRSSLPKMDNTR